jgi:hypothetical protein
LLTITAYCINFHINCGITGIHRYNSWVFAMMMFFLTIEVPALINRTIVRKFLYSSLMLSAVLTVCIVCFIVTSANGMNYIEMGPIASYVLEKAPWLYRPYPYTFISKVTHVDGGYTYERPVIYYDEAGYARKILVTPETAAQVLDSVRCNETDLALLREKLKKAESGTGFQYIDLNASTKVVERRF